MELRKAIKNVAKIFFSQICTKTFSPSRYVTFPILSILKGSQLHFQLFFSVPLNHPDTVTFFALNDFDSGKYKLKEKSSMLVTHLS